MVQADAVGHEALALVLLARALDADRGAAAHVIEEVVAVIDLGEAEEGQQLTVKGVRLVPLADRQDDVRHAVDFDHGRPQSMTQNSCGSSTVTSKLASCSCALCRWWRFWLTSTIARLSWRSITVPPNGSPSG